MHFDSIADNRKQVFVITRYILILSTGAMVFLEYRSGGSLWLIAFMVLVALASNVLLGSLPPRRFFEPSVQAPLLVGDTAMVSIMILFTRNGGELFLFFIFVLLMAAKINNLAALSLAGALVGLASMFLTGTAEVFSALMRVPFFFATALFFGYVALPERGETRSRPAKAKLRRLVAAPASPPIGMLQVDYETRLHAPRLR